VTARFELDDEGTSPTSPVEAPRPERPGAVELAAALLIVGGVLGMLSGLASLAPAQATSPTVALVTVVLNLFQVALGLLVRHGRLWLLAVNYAAVVGFLDLLAGTASVTALMLGLSEVLVVIVLLVSKPWFDAVRRWRSEGAGNAARRP
jgi:uncharacterized membrane protein